MRNSQPANTLSQAGPAPAFSSSKIPSDYLSSFEMINDTVRQSNDNTTELNHQTIFLSCLTEPSQNPSISTGDPTTTNLSTSPLCFNFDLVLFVFFYVRSYRVLCLPRSVESTVWCSRQQIQFFWWFYEAGGSYPPSHDPNLLYRGSGTKMSRTERPGQGWYEPLAMCRAIVHLK